MRKIFASIALLGIMVLSVCCISYAVEEEGSASLELISSINSDDKKVVVTLSTKELSKAVEKSVMGYQAYLEYDKNVFNSVNIEGLNDWEVTVNRESDGYFILETSDTPEILPNQSMARFTFTIKDGLETVDSKISLKNMKLVIDEKTIDYENVLTVNIKVTENREENTVPSERQTEELDEETGAGETQNDKENIEIINEEIKSTNDIPKANGNKTINQVNINQSTNSKTQPTILPKTGTYKIAIIVLVVASLAIAFLIKYKSIEIK